MEECFLDTQSICFTCLSSENSLISITEEHADYEEFIFMYETFTSISVAEMEKCLVICEACVTKLNEAFHFREMCIQNYKSLQNLRNEELKVKPTLNSLRQTFHSSNETGFDYIEMSSRLGNSAVTTQVDVRRDVKNACPSTIIKSYSLPTPNCIICNTVFETNEAYEEHSKISHISNDYKCGICDTAFRLPELLVNHIRSNHQKVRRALETKFVCSRCKKSYTSISSLRAHLYDHSQPFRCKYCNEEFTDENSLRRHKVVHSGRTQVCKVCGKNYKTPVLLHRHMWSHSAVKPFDCKLCVSTFVTNADLRIHMRCHTGERPFSCQECDKSFKRNTHLIVHIRTHTGEKPYKCSDCDRSFAQSGDLISHRRIHTGEKPYMCQFCEKRFKQNSGLHTHLRKHMDPDKLPCPVCSKTLSTPKLMLKHISDHTGHGDNMRVFLNKKAMKNSSVPCTT